MRILLLTQFFQPEPIFKGLPFARALQARGHEVEVLTGFPNYPGGRLYPGYKIRPVLRELIDGVPVTRVPLFPSHDRSAVRRMVTYLSFGASAVLGAARLRFRPEVVYVYNLVTLGCAAGVLRRRFGCPVVLDVQDLWPESVSTSGMMRNRMLKSVLQRWCRHEYRRPDRITVLSPGFKRHLEARGVPGERIEVVYNWCEEVPARLSASDRERVRAAAGMAGRFTVLFAGTMGKVQALDTVLRAAAALETAAPKVLLAFVGGGIEVDHLKALSAGRSNVRFIPKCSPTEAMGLIDAADAVLVHLKKDPLFAMTIPSKTQAYLYAGRPILMGVEGDAADLVRRAGAGRCFESENPESFAHEVLTMAHLSEAERATMGENGARFYAEHLAQACGVEHFEAVFARARSRGGIEMSS